jgi:hypothetical protein
MLREMAFILHLTRSLKQEIVEGRSVEPQVADVLDRREKEK